MGSAPSRPALEERSTRARVSYVQWVEEGWISATPGEVVDYEYVRAEVGRLGERFRLREIAFDRWGASKIRVELEADGFDLIQFGQGFASMSGPTKELERLVLQKRIDHGGNPVLRWMANNVTVATDPAGSIKPVKPGHDRSHAKIDGIVAAIMALERGIRNEGNAPPPESVYESYGMRSL